MIQYERIDINEGIDLNKTNRSVYFFSVSIHSMQG